MAEETSLPSDGLTAESPTAASSSGSTHRIGPYHVLGLLGAGGMGEVYKAERRAPLRQTVAIKIIKLGIDTREVVARFNSERQALARMDHPNVARVVDAGVTDDGRPYFVMEYVPGAPITKFADDNKLSIRDRLELFTQACDAIAHAHTKAIIHRDIKPSNVLAYMHDEKATVKVIDFGIAKALTGDRLTDVTFNTEQGRIVGTYDSMSPEQADGSPDIDTRTDVYSLGVLLYELLTGAKPFDHDTLARAADGEVRRIICEVEPPRPSTRLTSLKEDATRIAAARRSRIDQLTKELRSELEWIPLKAMRKERDRRYAGPAQFADDIRNYLNHAPLIAAPESRAYHLRKFLIRNRRPVLVGAVVIAVIVGGAISTAIMYVRAEQQRRLAADNAARADKEAIRATSEAAKQEAVNRFLVEMLGSADAGNLSVQDRAKGRNITLVQVLDESAKKLDRGDLHGQPEIEGTVRKALGNAYGAIGEFGKADVQLRTALDLYRELRGGEHRDVADAMNDYGILLSQEGKRADAERLHRQALAMNQRLLGAEHPDVAASMENLAQVLDAEGKLADAEALYRQALSMYRKLQGPEHRNIATALGDLGKLLERAGKLEEAEQRLRQALAMQRKLLGSEHPDVAASLGYLARVLRAGGRLAEAEDLYRQALGMSQKLLGPNHPEVATGLSDLANLMKEEAKLAEAEALDRQALAIRQRSLGEAHPDLARSLSNLASILLAEGKLAEAEPLYRQAIEMRRKLGPEQPDAAKSMVSLAFLLQQQRRFAEAESLYRQALEIFRSALPAGLPDVAATSSNLAAVLRAQGKLADAEPLLREALELRRKALPAGQGDIAQSANNLAVLLHAEGKLAEAEPLYREALEFRRQKLGPRATSTAQTATALAMLLDSTNRPADAAALRKEYGLRTPTTATQPATAPATTAAR